MESIEVDAPRVGIIMGSKSDMDVMDGAAKVLREADVRHEVRVMSAHREPELVAEYCRNARMRGLRVIIAGAGLSRRAAGRRRRAHRPAGHRRAAVQPPVGDGRHGLDPVGPADAAGRAGRGRRLDNAKNAGHLALRILRA